MEETTTGSLVEAPCVDRVNVQPAILLGLSSNEAMMTIGLSFALWSPVSILVGGMLMRSMPITVAILSFGPLATTYFAAKKMAAVKRDRPDQYYLHLLRQYLARKGVRRSRFLGHEGVWDLGRSLPPRRSGT